MKIQLPSFDDRPVSPAMAWTVFYLLAITLHLLVLLWATPLIADKLPPKKQNEKKVIVINLSSEPGPARAGPDSGPSDQAKSAANPGPVVDDSPPPVAVIAPTSAEPPPAAEPPPDILPPALPPPVPDVPTTAAEPQPPPVASAILNEVQPPPAIVAPTPPDTPIAPTTLAADSASPANQTSSISAAPVSGAGRGNAAQWSPGAGGNGHFYRAFAVPHGITWGDANKFANTHGGYLVTITSAAENLFVFNLIKDPKFWLDDSNPFYDGPWLGGFKSRTSRNPAEGWQWVHNEGPFKYTNWSPPNPDNDRGHGWEDSLNYWSGRGLKPSPGWNDRNGNSAVNGFVMEYDTEAAYLAGHPEIDPFPLHIAPFQMRR